MKVLIDISEKLYKNVVERTKMGYIGSDVWIAVANGIPVSIDGDSISRSDLKKAITELNLDNTSHWSVIHKINIAPTLDIPKPNCVTCDHFGKCEGCEKREEE